MSLNRIILIFIIIIFVFSGIVALQLNRRPQSQSATNETSLPGNSTVIIHDRTFKVEVARTHAEQEKGLSGRNSLAQDQGMLFLFNEPGYHNFWMKGMKFPLDIIFIRGDKIVTVLENMPAPQSETANLPPYPPEAEVDKVLEINGGLSNKYNIKKGDSVKIQL